MVNAGYAGQQAGASVGATTAPRQSQVAEATIRQSQAAKYLHERIEQLESRLASILRPVGPSDANKAQGKYELVAHAAHLSETADLIEAASVRIEDVLSRLEL